MKEEDSEEKGTIVVIQYLEYRIKHINLTMQIQLCEKKEAPHVEDQWYNKEKEPQSLWNISIQFEISQRQSKGKRMRIWEKKIKKKKVQ